MRGLKKVLAGILAGAMALTLGLSAGNAVDVKAAGNGSITVSNTTKDYEYELYKVFDAAYTTDDNGNRENIAYSYDGSNADFLAALQAETSPFSVSSYNDGGKTVYNVVAKESASKDDVLTFIKNNGPVYDETTKEWSKGNYTLVQTLTGNGGSLTFEGLDYGYYFIKSGLGATVTINSAVPSQTVIDKNQETTLVDKQEGVANAANEIEWFYEGNGTSEDPIPTQAVGLVVNYKLVGTVTQYQKTAKVEYLLFTDTMSEGLTPNKDVKVEIDGKNVTETATISYDDEKNVTTIKVPTVDNTEAKNFLYNSNASYVITYTATINEKALDGVRDNKVTLTDNNGSDFGADETKVTNYEITLTKVDASNANKKLSGAQFRLYTTQEGKADNSDEVKVVLVSGTGKADSEVNNVYRVAKEGESKDAVEMVTGKTGIIEVKGLKNGSYFFEETVAPVGYNLLPTRSEATTITNANATITVKNNSGSLLPSTGGMGTTLFYIVGGILIVAGVAYFMVRRKAQAE